MKVVLLRVGIDTGSGGIHGPLFQDGSFEYISIPESTPDFAHETRTYGKTIGRHGEALIKYFPPGSLRDKRQGEALHLDPEFDSFTYGDPTSLKARLRFLEKGDILAFYAGLKGWDFDRKDALYLIGYFVVEMAGRLVPQNADNAYIFSSEEVEKYFSKNAHISNGIRFRKDSEKLVLVKGNSQESRLLQKAYQISAEGKNVNGQRLKVLSEEMQKTFGDFDGKIAIERSAPRWIDSSFVHRAADFLRSLD